MDHPQDHFSDMATVYKDARLSYPQAIYLYLRGLCERHTCAWDCATGSGEAAVDLARFFDKVIATDISESLLSLARREDNIEFRLAPAERSEIPANSVDLVTVAQAIHWFDREGFWVEVDRVLRPKGILAFWGYLWPIVDEEIDRILEAFRRNIETFWPERSRYLHERYEGVNPPMTRLENPDFMMTREWSSAQYLKHLSSWSATRYFQESTRTDPVSVIEADLKTIWGEETRTVRWPLILKVYQKAEWRKGVRSR